MSRDRYTIVSADGHAGADVDDYRPYLESYWLDEFDRWRGQFVNAWSDLESAGRERNWDSAVRQRDLEADGIVAEVLFPNTIPPFFPSGQLAAYPPRTTEERTRRSAGLRAHNRWLADWCAELPGRRAGLAQVFLGDVEAAVAEVEWAAGAGLKGILVPAIPPDQGIPPLWSDVYDPLWAACTHHDLAITQHGGSGLPDLSDSPAPGFLMLMEVPFFANRSLWHLILGGAFERFPELRFAMTEQRVDWVPATIAKMDVFWTRFTEQGAVGEMGADPVQLPHPPSFYFERNCWLGASFPGAREATVIEQIGPSRVMWGSDYPHLEGTTPHSREALRYAFHDWEPSVLHDVLGGTAAEVYRLDLDELAGHGIGPTVDEIAEPITDLPDSPSIAFAAV